MPRLAYRQPAYRLPKSSGQAVVSIGGRKFYLGPYRSAASKERYNQLLQEWLASNRELPAQYRTQSLTVVELMAKYLAHAKAYYVKNGKPTGELKVIKWALKLLKGSYGRTPVEEFGPLALKVFRNAMIEKDWARRTINKQVQRIVRMFRWGASEQLFSVTIADQLATLEGLRAGRCAAPDRPPVAPVDDAIVDATLPHLPPIVADMGCAIYTCKLRWPMSSTTGASTTCSSTSCARRWRSLFFEGCAAPIGLVRNIWRRSAGGSIPVEWY